MKKSMTEKGNNSKKLIYVINHYSRNSDQHLYHTLNLLKSIAERGVKIALVIERCYDDPGFIHENIDVYGQKETKGFRRLQELYNILIKNIKNGYDKIFVRISTKATITALMAAQRYGAEVYYWHSGAAFEQLRSQPLQARIKWYLTWYTQFSYIKKNVNYFVSGPESMLDYYYDEGNVPKDKLRLLYNDIDLSRFSAPTNFEKLQLRKKLLIDENKICVLLVHRFSPLRKTDFYFPYIAENIDQSNVTFLLVGSGPDKQIVEEKTAEKGMNNVKFLGSIPNTEIQEYYKACDILINPSYCEGFSRVLIEAMASGLPIVTTDAGGTRDLFGEFQIDYVVNKSDRDAFRVALHAMLESSSIRTKCKEENLQQVIKYSTENVAEMYIETIWGK